MECDSSLLQEMYNNMIKLLKGIQSEEGSKHCIIQNCIGGMRNFLISIYFCTYFLHLTFFANAPLEMPHGILRSMIHDQLINISISCRRYRVDERIKRALFASNRCRKDFQIIINISGATLIRQLAKYV